MLFRVIGVATDLMLESLLPHFQIANALVATHGKVLHPLAYGTFSL